MSRILVVTKDMAGFQIYSRVVPVLRKHAQEVSLIAEGLSVREWVDREEKFFVGDPTREDVDPVTLARRDILMRCFRRASYTTWTGQTGAPQSEWWKKSFYSLVRNNRQYISGTMPLFSFFVHYQWALFGVIVGILWRTYRNKTYWG